MFRHDRSTSGEGSPVLGILMLGAITVTLAAGVGVLGFGSTGGGFSSPSVDADYDTGDTEVSATVLDLRGADHVNVSIYGYGYGVKARLDGSGSRLVVGEESARVAGKGRIYDLQGDAVASVDGSAARLHDGQGVPTRGRIRVRAVAVQGGNDRVVLDTEGSL